MEPRLETTAVPCHDHFLPEEDAVSFLFYLVLAQGACAMGTQVITMDDNETFKGK